MQESKKFSYPFYFYVSGFWFKGCDSTHMKQSNQDYGAAGFLYFLTNEADGIRIWDIFNRAWYG